jgi:hypothetical protein
MVAVCHDGNCCFIVHGCVAHRPGLSFWLLVVGRAYSRRRRGWRWGWWLVGRSDGLRLPAALLTGLHVGAKMFCNSARCSTVVHGFTGFACKTHVVEKAAKKPLMTCSIRTCSDAVSRGRPSGRGRRR